MKTTTRFEFDLGDVQFDTIDASEYDFLNASDGEPGELFRFRNAVLARAEVNKNKDGLTAENIDELAATLPLMPINLEHEGSQIRGFFTAARNVSGALMVDGIVFARHFPENVKDILDNKLRLSIEGFAKATRIINGVRWFEGLKAIGGALTERPAGSNTGFQNSSVLMIASEQEPEEEPQMERIAELEATIAEMEANIKALEAARTDAEALAASRQTELEEAQNGLQAAEAAVETQVAEVRQTERLIASRAVALLAAGSTQEEVDELWEELGTLSDKMFAKLVAAAQAPAQEEDTGLEASEEDEEDEGDAEFVASSVQDDDTPADTTPAFEFV